MGIEDYLSREVSTKELTIQLEQGDDIVLYNFSKNSKFRKVFIVSFMITNIHLFCYSQTEDNLELSQEYSKFVSKRYKKNWENTYVEYKFYYEGSDVPPAEIFLYSNGVFVLKSRFDSKDFKEIENRFFLYDINNGRINIKPVDRREDIDLFINVASYHVDNDPSVIFVDRKNGMILQFDNSINFLGFIFIQEY